jgi:Tfp pilus assembly protein PilO
MNKPNNLSGRRKTNRQPTFSEKMRARALKLGAAKLFLFSSLLALAVGALIYTQFLSSTVAANDALRVTLAEKRKQNAIARQVQETKPQFLEEFRRLITNYTTARELLPSETEVSNVLAAIQQMASANQVRVTMFDASKPGAKSINPAAAATAPAEPTTSAAPADSAKDSAKPAPQPQITLNERTMPAQIQGTHANVARFLSAVAQYPRIIYVKDFSITSLNRQESVNLTLVTYDAPTSGNLPPIPAELREEFQNQTARLDIHAMTQKAVAPK